MRNNFLAAEAVDYIKHYIGLPYKWGGDDSIEGFDCSGLAIEMLKAVGIVDDSFDDTADGLYRVLTPVSRPEKGCLVFYGKNGKATHVAICIGNKLMIEAGGGGRNVLNEEDAKKYNAQVRIRPIYSRNDYLGIRDPFEGKIS